MGPGADDEEPGQPGRGTMGDHHLVRRPGPVEDDGWDSGLGPVDGQVSGLGGIAGPEGDKILGELFNPGSASDPLVVNLHIRVGLGVFSDPSLIERSGEGRAGTLQLRCRYRRPGEELHCQRRQQEKGNFGIFHTRFATTLQSSI